VLSSIRPCSGAILSRRLFAEQTVQDIINECAQLRRGSDGSKLIDPDIEILSPDENLAPDTMMGQWRQRISQAVP
jgi:hypothetical protein